MTQVHEKAPTQQGQCDCCVLVSTHNLHGGARVHLEDDGEILGVILEDNQGDVLGWPLGNHRILNHWGAAGVANMNSKLV